MDSGTPQSQPQLNWEIGSESTIIPQCTHLKLDKRSSLPEGAPALVPRLLISEEASVELLNQFSADRLEEIGIDIRMIKSDMANELVSGIIDGVFGELISNTPGADSAAPMRNRLFDLLVAGIYGIALFIVRDDKIDEWNEISGKITTGYRSGVLNTQMTNIKHRPFPRINSSVVVAITGWGVATAVRKCPMYKTSIPPTDYCESHGLRCSHVDCGLRDYIFDIVITALSSEPIGWFATHK